jgi:integrase
LPNPVKGRKPKPNEGRVRWLTQEQAQALIAAAEKGPRHLKPFIILALNTGMRKAELLGLEWDRVNLGQRLILLEGQHTKANKRRAVPVNDNARSALMELWQMRQAQNQRWVFSEDGERPLGNVRKSFLGACERAGIADFHIHDLRHTCASWLVSEGVELSAVRDLLGHSTTAMSEKYAHLSPERVRQAVGKLDCVSHSQSHSVKNGSNGGT